MSADKVFKTKPYYESATDIFFYFSNKEKTAAFFKFFYEEALAFSKKIDDAGRNKPYPVNFDDNSNQYQYDYHFFIYILAKWVGIQTGEVSKSMLVLKDYAITTYTLSKISSKMKRRFLSIFLGERLGVHNYYRMDLLKEQEKNGYEKYGLDKYKSVYVSEYPSNSMKILQLEKEYFEVLNISVSGKGMRNYFEDYLAYMEENEGYFIGKNVKQSAFGFKDCISFWKKLKAKNGTLKRYYFPIVDNDFLGKFDEILERNVSI